MVNLAKFVQEIKELPRIEGLFIEGHSGCNSFKGVSNTPVMALRLIILSILISFQIPSHAIMLHV